MVSEGLRVLDRLATRSGGRFAFACDILCVRHNMITKGAVMPRIAQERGRGSLRHACALVCTREAAAVRPNKPYRFRIAVMPTAHRLRIGNSFSSALRDASGPGAFRGTGRCISVTMAHARGCKVR